MLLKSCISKTILHAHFLFIIVLYVFHYREYLLGFRKRKNERRKKAQDDLIKKEKERRKELKQEVCYNYLST